MPQSYEPADEIVARPQSFPREVPNVRIEYLVGRGYVIAAPIVALDGSKQQQFLVFDADNNLLNTVTYADHYQSNPDIEVSAMPDGGFVVVHAIERIAQGTASSTPGDVSWGRYDAQGNFIVGTLANLNPDQPAYPAQSGTGTAQLQPDVVALADGTSFVVFQDSSAYALDAPDIFLQRIAPDGSWIGGPIQVNQTGAGVQSEPEVIALANGNVAVGWIVEGVTDSVWTQILTPAGTVTLNDTLVSSRGSISDLSLDALDGGGYVAVWQIDGDIYGQILSSSGTVEDAPFRLTVDTAGIQDNPRVQAVDGGGFVVTWQDDASGTAQILARLFDSTGHGEAQFAVDPGATIQGNPDVARLANGDLEFTWSNETDHTLMAIRYTHTAASPPIQGTDGPDTLLGTVRDDTLMAFTGDDILIGLAGADRLDGGDGTDTASYAPDEGAVFVNLTLGMGYGNAAQGDTYISIENVIGTAYDDFLIGDPSVNRLDGGGGNDILVGAVGEDVLVGGTGIDTASYEDNSGTVFVDLLHRVGFNNAAEGDTYEGIENAIGGLFDDTLIGDDGANRLDGAMGADTLVGNGGADIFVFAHAPGASSPFGSDNFDTLFDFTSGEDMLEISASAFGGGLAPGSLPSDAFALGSVAGDANDRFVYDQEAGKLWFDADGSGSGAAVLVAILPNHNTIAASDFVVV